MHADAWFAGKDGRGACQDYALAGAVDGRPHAIVVDGCSSSYDGDLGPRLLARAAERELLEHGARLDGDRIVRVAAGMASAVLGHALRQPEASEVLDSTLMTATFDGERVHVLVAGDGSVAARRRGGGVDSWTVRFPGGAPAYPSYGLDRRRRAAYLAQTRGARTVVQCDGGVLRTHHRRGFSPERFAFSPAEHDLILLVTDGADSFTDGTRPIAVEAVLAELIEVRATRGSFVQRRCSRFLGRTCVERGWKHTDDLGVAALWLGDAA